MKGKMLIVSMATIGLILFFASGCDQNKALEKMLSNPDITAKIMEKIWENPELKAKLAEKVLADPELQGKLMDQMLSNHNTMTTMMDKMMMDEWCKTTLTEKMKPAEKPKPTGKKKQFNHKKTKSIAINQRCFFICRNILLRITGGWSTVENIINNIYNIFKGD